MNTPTRRWFEYRHLVTFGDTNSAGSVYFARYFAWQGECRERLLAQFYPEFAHDLQQGFCLTTEFAHQDFLGEATLFDQVLIRMSLVSLTRSRLEFEFEFLRERDAKLLGRGRQAVLWTNSHRHPSLMPEKLYQAAITFFGVSET